VSTAAAPFTIANINAFMSLLPYLENDVLYQACLSGLTSAGTPTTANISAYDCLAGTPGTANNTVRYQVIKVFLCPADYGVTSANYSRNSAQGASSYAANWQLFGTPTSGTGTSVLKLNNIKDGNSQTILFAEKLAACPRTQWPPTGVTTPPAVAAANVGTLWWYPSSVDWVPIFAWDHPSYQTTQTANPPYLRNWNQPPLIQPAVTNSSTSTGPLCDVSQPSTGHAGSSIVCMADGSVRAVAGNISQATWQAAILPEDGVPLGNDW